MFWPSVPPEHIGPLYVLRSHFGSSIYFQVVHICAHGDHTALRVRGMQHRGIAPFQIVPFGQAVNHFQHVQRLVADVKPNYRRDEILRRLEALEAWHNDQVADARLEMKGLRRELQESRNEARRLQEEVRRLQFRLQQNTAAAAAAQAAAGEELDQKQHSMRAALKAQAEEAERQLAQAVAEERIRSPVAAHENYRALRCLRHDEQLVPPHVRSLVGVLSEAVTMSSEHAFRSEVVFAMHMAIQDCESGRLRLQRCQDEVLAASENDLDSALQLRDTMRQQYAKLLQQVCAMQTDCHSMDACYGKVLAKVPDTCDSSGRNMGSADMATALSTCRSALLEFEAWEKRRDPVMVQKCTDEAFAAARQALLDSRLLCKTDKCDVADGFGLRAQGQGSAQGSGPV